MSLFVLYVLSVSLIVLCKSQETVVSSYACFNARYYKQSTIFTAPRNGTINGTKLVYINGSVTSTGNDATNWGSGNSFFVQLVRIIDEASYSVETLYPRNSTQYWQSTYAWSTCTGGCYRRYYNLGTQYSNTDEEFIWSNPLWNVTTNDLFALQFSEACCNLSINDNHGTTCAEIYFNYLPSNSTETTLSSSDNPTSIPSDSPTSISSDNPSPIPSPDSTTNPTNEPTTGPANRTNITSDQPTDISTTLSPNLMFEEKAEDLTYIVICIAISLVAFCLIACGIAACIKCKCKTQKKLQLEKQLSTQSVNNEINIVNIKKKSTDIEKHREKVLHVNDIPLPPPFTPFAPQTNNNLQLNDDVSINDDDEEYISEVDDNAEKIIQNPLVLLLCIAEYEQQSGLFHLPGVQNDLVKYKHLWEDIYNYSVYTKDNEPFYWTRNDILGFIDANKLRLIMDKHDGMIIIISGHGGNGTIYTSKGNQVLIHDLHSKLSGTFHEKARRVPRIFVVDTCRGSVGNANDVKMYGKGSQISGAIQSRLLTTLYGNPLGYRTYVIPKTGSIFSDCFVNVFTKSVTKNKVFGELVNKITTFMEKKYSQVAQCDGDTRVNQYKLIINDIVNNIVSLKEFLTNIDLMKYYDVMCKNDVEDLEILKELNEDEMKNELGMSFGDAKKLIKSLRSV